ncbi:MAG: hypothetical protein K2X27_19895 [Candidatus Obscuribacterales bacterium]|nr:hypothetical protein [Candidatus Obscuribacterales bacterium]
MKIQSSSLAFLSLGLLALASMFVSPAAIGQIAFPAGSKLITTGGDTTPSGPHKIECQVKNYSWPQRPTLSTRIHEKHYDRQVVFEGPATL